MSYYLERFMADRQYSFNEVELMHLRRGLLMVQKSLERQKSSAQGDAFAKLYADVLKEVGALLFKCGG